MGKQKLTLKEMQKESLKILQFMDNFCLQNDLQYWIMYGTLIGAVRHQGFIPWDDDIDIAMKRDDYNKLIKMANDNEECFKPYKLMHYTTSKKYPHYIVRICSSVYQGVFVDVYPFDDAGSDVNYWSERHSNIEFRKKMMLMACHTSLFYGKNVVSKVANLPLMLWAKIKGRDYYMEQFETQSQIFNGSGSGYIGLTCWATNVRIFQEELFDEFIRIPFENITVSAPKHYDSILASIYGDYMKLPPKEQQRPHHGFIDL